MTFADKDPEDVWDDGDPYRERLRVLEAIIADLRDGRDDPRRPGRLDNARRLADKLETEREEDRRRLKRIIHDLRRL